MRNQAVRLLLGPIAIGVFLDPSRLGAGVLLPHEETCNELKIQ